MDLSELEERLSESRSLVEEIRRDLANFNEAVVASELTPLLLSVRQSLELELHRAQESVLGYERQMFQKIIGEYK